MKFEVKSKVTQVVIILYILIFMFLILTWNYSKKFKAFMLAGIYNINNN